MVSVTIKTEMQFSVKLCCSAAIFRWEISKYFQFWRIRGTAQRRVWSAFPVNFEIGWSIFEVMLVESHRNNWFPHSSFFSYPFTSGKMWIPTLYSFSGKFHPPLEKEGGGSKCAKASLVVSGEFRIVSALFHTFLISLSKFLSYWYFSYKKETIYSLIFL